MGPRNPNELRTERSALQTEVARLEEFERLIETISGQYATFLGSDETDSSGPDAVLESKFRLETFLTEADVAGLSGVWRRETGPREWPELESVWRREQTGPPAACAPRAR